MFSTNIRQLYKVCDKVIIRTLRGRLRVPDPSISPNPGLDKRLQALRKEKVDVRDDNIEEILEKSDSDFSTVDRSYHDFMEETLAGKHILRQKIIKEKYFKENMPNLLTWSEKEQIRNLHARNPQEWTPEYIAESFPVTAAVAKKLIKYPWKPASEQRIERHDASALRNWKMLKEGSLGIPEEMRQHFLKFSDRTIPPLQKKSIKVDITRDKELGEFQKIVDRCAANEKSEQIKLQDSPQVHKQSNQEMKPDKSRTTLNELTNKIKQRLEAHNEVEFSDKVLIDTVNSITAKTANNNLLSKIELEKEQKSLSDVRQSDEIVTVASYPERIRIPKKAYRRGATYKVNDCYYDADGRFLYRVIGLNK